VQLAVQGFVFLLTVNVLLLVFGLFIDTLPGVMIRIPISLALVNNLDRFTIVVIVILTFGLATPTVGNLISGVCSRTNPKPSEL
jgi:TRAP-type C4-dicarboxylate transport system permease large subunit